MATTFKFLGVKDCGSTSCPHCGAEGRYIYSWEYEGKGYSAMAGCYKALTGHITKDDVQRFYEILAEKQAKNKSLNGWEKTILRMQEFIREGKYSVEWCNQKINEALTERQRFLAKRF